MGHGHLVQKRGHEVTLKNQVDLKDIQLLMLRDGVRRVGIYHKCVHSCRVDIQSKTAVHSSAILTGSVFTLQGRKDGYPPKQA